MPKSQTPTDKWYRSAGHHGGPDGMLSTYPLPQSRSKSNTGLPVRAKPTKSGGLLSAFPSPHRLRTKGHLHAKFSPSELHPKSRTAHFIPSKGSTKVSALPWWSGGWWDGKHEDMEVSHPEPLPGCPLSACSAAASLWLAAPGSALAGSCPTLKQSLPGQPTQDKSS